MKKYQRSFGQKQWIMQFTFQIGLQQEVYKEKNHKKNGKEVKHFPSKSC